MTLEDIKVSLDSNPNLDDELRDNIYSLVYIFNNKFPNISLENLCKNLKTLKIKKSSKFVNKRVSKYDFRENVLEFNINKINEGYDMKHVLMFELLNIITNNGDMTGFNLNDEYRALNAAYTEILTNNLVGNDSDISDLDEEMISTNMIALLVDPDIMFEAYFNNDIELIKNAWSKKGISE